MSSAKVEVTVSSVKATLLNAGYTYGTSAYVAAFREVRSGRPCPPPPAGTADEMPATRLRTMSTPVLRATPDARGKHRLREILGTSPSTLKSPVSSTANDELEKYSSPRRRGSHKRRGSNALQKALQRAGVKAEGVASPQVQSQLFSERYSGPSRGANQDFATEDSPAANGDLATEDGVKDEVDSRADKEQDAKETADVSHAEVTQVPIEENGQRPEDGERDKDDDEEEEEEGDSGNLIDGNFSSHNISSGNLKVIYTPVPELQPALTEVKPAKSDTHSSDNNVRNSGTISNDRFAIIKGETRAGRYERIKREAYEKAKGELEAARLQREELAKQERDLRFQQQLQQQREELARQLGVNGLATMPPSSVNPSEPAAPAPSVSIPSTINTNITSTTNSKSGGDRGGDGRGGSGGLFATLLKPFQSRWSESCAVLHSSAKGAHATVKHEVLGILPGCELSRDSAAGQEREQARAEARAIARAQAQAQVELSQGRGGDDGEASEEELSERTRQEAIWRAAEQRARLQLERNRWEAQGLTWTLEKSQVAEVTVLDREMEMEGTEGGREARDLQRTAAVEAGDDLSQARVSPGSHRFVPGSFGLLVQPVQSQEMEKMNDQEAQWDGYMAESLTGEVEREQGLGQQQQEEGADNEEEKDEPVVATRSPAKPLPVAAAAITADAASGSGVGTDGRGGGSGGAIPSSFQDLDVGTSPVHASLDTSSTARRLVMQTPPHTTTLAADTAAATPSTSANGARSWRRRFHKGS